MYNSNSDGVGFAYSNGSKIIVKKFRAWEEFYKSYTGLKNLYGNKSSFLLHFRIRTHGTNKGLFNVHPFRVNKELVFAHNGTIQNVGESVKKSDTRLFNEIVLKHLNPNFLNDKATRKLIEGFIGYSKLAFLDIKGGYNILNEHKGEWDKKRGIWYSNTSYKPYEYESYGSGYSYGGYTYNNRTGFKHNVINPKPKAVNIKPPKSKQLKLTECTWCGSKAKSQAVEIKWDALQPPEQERMCGECVDQSLQCGAYSVNYK